MAAGKKTGGRKRGTPNRATAAKAAQIAASGLTPLDYMLSILRDELRSPDDRFEAAKAAAPYCHPKRAPVDGDGEEASGLVVIVQKP
jgi:hypothetical protein